MHSHVASGPSIHCTVPLMHRVAGSASLAGALGSAHTRINDLASFQTSEATLCMAFFHFLPSRLSDHRHGVCAKTPSQKRLFWQFCTMALFQAVNIYFLERRQTQMDDRFACRTQAAGVFVLPETWSNYCKSSSKATRSQPNRALLGCGSMGDLANLFRLFIVVHWIIHLHELSRRLRPLFC